MQAAPFRLPGAVGEPAGPRLPRLRRARSRAASVAPGRPRRRAPVRARDDASRGSSTYDGDLERRRRRPGGHAHARRRDRRQPRRRDRRRADAPPAGRATSSRRRSSGWPRSRCCAAAPTSCASARRRSAATIAPLKYKLNVDSLEHVAATQLDLNEIGVCDLELTEPIAFDPYTENRDTGGFILIDRITNNTVGAGLLRFALRRSHNVPLAGARRRQGRARGRCRASSRASSG